MLVLELSPSLFADQLVHCLWQLMPLVWLPAETDWKMEKRIQSGISLKTASLRPDVNFSVHYLMLTYCICLIVSKTLNWPQKKSIKQAIATAWSDLMALSSHLIGSFSLFPDSEQHQVTTSLNSLQLWTFTENLMLICFRWRCEWTRNSVKARTDVFH